MDLSIPGAMPLSWLNYHGTVTNRSPAQPLLASESSTFPVTLPSSLALLQSNIHLQYQLTQATQGAECYHCNPITFIWVTLLPHPPKSPPLTLVSFHCSWRHPFIQGCVCYIFLSSKPNWIRLSLHHATLTERGVINERGLAEKVPALRCLIYGCTWGWQQGSPARSKERERGNDDRKGLLCSSYIRLLP